MESIGDRDRLIEDISRMRNGSFEQMFLITTYSLNSYLKSLFAFGKNSNLTKDNLNVIREMFGILKTERIFLNYILRHIDEFDIHATEDVVDMLDRANDEAVLFYYDVINDLEDAAEMGDAIRGIRRRQTSPTLIQSTSYASQVVALGENIDSLKRFLGYEEEFWNYINKEKKEINTTAEIADKMGYASPLLDENGNIVRILLVVPKIVDLGTALVAIKLYKRAHDLYLMMGKQYDNSMVSDSASLQQEYENVYIAGKAMNLLNKRM